LKVFVDNNLPPRLARGLDALFADDHTVICHRDKFGDTHIADEDWIVALGAEGGWVVLSGDLNIARKRPSRELFLRSQLVGFFPRRSVMEMPLAKKAARVLTVWD
jgi:PIN like domain